MKKVTLVVSISVLLATTAVAQDIKTELTGAIEIDGSSTVAPISTEAAVMFGEEYPNVKIPVGVSGTGGGFKRFTKGDTDISNASRPIKDKEFAACKKNGVEFIEIPIAYDGLTIAVNKNNTWVKKMTVEQLEKIFLAGSAAKTWDQVDPSWPKKEIKIFAPGTDSGTFDYFKEVVAGKKGSIRADMSVSEDDNNLVQGIANTETAIGFFGAAYYFENTDKLTAVPIVNPNGKAVPPSSETIGNGTYAPFSRPLFIYINSKAASRPEVKRFVKHYLDNAADIAETVGYVGLPENIYADAHVHFKKRMTGTHYWTKDGAKRHGALAEIYKTSNLLK